MAREPVEVGSGHKGAPAHVTSNPSSRRYGEVRSDRSGARPSPGKGAATRKDNTPEPTVGGYRSPLDGRD
jgi:hypothetical protein